MIVQVIEGGRGRKPELQSWALDLRDERLWVRERAAAHLAARPDEARGAIGALAAALADPAAQVRQRAARALAAAGADALDCLTVTLGHRRPVAREWAAALLGRLGPAARPALAALHEAAADAEWSVRTAAAEALRSISQS
jgi:HEAT repeat protein